MAEGGWLKFLGTAGARFVVMKQLRASGGLWVEMNGLQFLIDPGPGTLVRAAASRPALDASRLAGLILTHRHLDHANDVNVMIEAMSNGGSKRHGLLLAPREALEDDPVVLHYCRPFLEGIQVLEEGGTYRLGEVSIRTPIRHLHGAETYGLILEAPAQPKIGLIVDTRFFDGLLEAYAGVDILVLHTVRYDKHGSTPEEILHLNVADAERLIQSIRPKTAILTHFGMTMVRAKPWLVAEELSQRTGTKVIAASDGMRLELA
ncbi:MAG: MBL fold metallo-hydrolase [candidate division KSB1 bacterium]|nr:MBL fold metallo-hydrolase [candidate division KSB1 bacterium]